MQQQRRTFGPAQIGLVDVEVMVLSAQCFLGRHVYVVVAEIHGEVLLICAFDGLANYFDLADRMSNRLVVRLRRCSLPHVYFVFLSIKHLPSSNVVTETFQAVNQGNKKPRTVNRAGRGRHQ
ncbi:MAG: hypothetical protein R2873_11090, partial [Caldilineaceae bacterium]